MPSSNRPSSRSGSSSSRPTRGDDPADGVPVDPDQPADRGLVGARGKPRDELLEIAGELRAGPGERDALDADAAGRALKAPQPSPDLQPPHAEVEVAPARVDRPPVMPVPGLKLALRALEPAPAQRHLHDHPSGLKLDLPDPH